MSKPNKELDNLLTEMVEEALIFEDEDGDYGGYGGYGDGGHGGGYGSSSEMYKTFVQPFTDIAGSVLHAVQTLTVGGREMLRHITTNIPKLLIPFFRRGSIIPSYDDIEDSQTMRKRQDGALATVHNQYADILKRNSEMMRDHDLWGFAFFMDPTSMLGAKAVQQVPGLATSMLDVLGLNSLHTSYAQRYTYGPRNLRVDDGLQPSSKPLITEEVPNKNDEQAAKMFADPKVIQALKTNPQIIAVRKAMLAALVAEVKDFLSIKSFEDLLAKGEGQLNTLQQFMNNSYKEGKIKKPDVASLKQGVVAEFKKEYKKHYVDMLTSMMSKAPAAKADIQSAIKQIQSLK